MAVNETETEAPNPMRRGFGSIAKDVAEGAEEAIEGPLAAHPFDLPARQRQQIGECRWREMKKMSRDIEVIPIGAETAEEKPARVGDGAAQEGAGAGPPSHPPERAERIVEVLQRM